VPGAFEGPRRIGGGAVSRELATWIERHALFFAALLMIASVILTTSPSHLNQDAWLALADGRYVAEHGIPHHDTLAVLTRGARWIDQQWLGQLTIYGVYRLGGLALYSVLYVSVTVGALGAAIWASRRLGGSEAHVMWALPLAAFLYFAGSGNIRAQGFAYPLFVATLLILAREARGRGGRGLYLLFPLLIVWANLHGSAILGCGLALLCGVSVLVSGPRRAECPRMRRRALALIVGAPVCLLVTPYGLSTVGYYRATLANPAFKALVTEWQPITSVMILAVPFFIVAFASVWVLARVRFSARLFDALALLVLIAAAISAERNVTWFALAVVVLLPPLLGEVAKPRPQAARRPRMNIALVGICAAWLGVSVTLVALKPAAWFQRDYSERALSTVGSLAREHPDVKIYADARFADWLLWRDPALTGRIAFDSRLELLTEAQMRRVATIAEIRAPGEPALLDPYRLLVMDTADPTSLRILSQPGTHVLVRGERIAVASRSRG
jgi:hypothetical protein